MHFLFSLSLVAFSFSSFLPFLHSASSCSIRFSLIVLALFCVCQFAFAVSSLKMLRCRLPSLSQQQLLHAAAAPAAHVRAMHASAAVAAMPALATVRRASAAAAAVAAASSSCCPCCIRSCSAAVLPTAASRSFASSSKSSPASSAAALNSRYREDLSTPSTVASRAAKQSASLLTRLGFNPLGYRVAIFGRPNVGKSTLFNRLAGRSLAIVDSAPGVTRDRKEADATIGELEFKLVDTAGLEEVQQFLTTTSTGSKGRGKNKGGKARNSAGEFDSDAEYRLVDKAPMSLALQEGIMLQTSLALAEADIAIFMIDGRAGVTPLDRFFAKWLRRQCSSTARVVAPDGTVTHVQTKKPVVLLANKCDNAEHESQYSGLTEGFELGFGEPVAISADHSGGMSGLHNALYAAMLSLHPLKSSQFAERERKINEEVAQLASIRQIRLAIVGKVNTGKSTLVNTLLQEARTLTGEQPGVTRDPVEIEWRDAEEEAKEEAALRRKMDQEREQEEQEEIEKMSGRQRREKREAEAAAAAAEAEAEATATAMPPSSDSSSSSTALVPVSPPAAPAPPAYRFTLVDTAGLKGVTSHAHAKYGRVDSMAMGLTLRAIERANVVALCVDISEARIDGVTGAPAPTPAGADGKSSSLRKQKVKGERPLKQTKSVPSTSLDPDATPLAHMLFKPGRRYTEVERGFLLRTFVRHVFSAADLAIASKTLREGRALLIILNKFDLVPPGPLRAQILEGVTLELNNTLSASGGGVTVLGISGASRYDIFSGQPLKTTLRSAVIALYEKWSKRVPTHALNRWLAEVVKFHPPPSVRVGVAATPRKTSLKFIQQVSTGPPAFVIFSNHAGSSLAESYRLFLVRGLREQFGLEGVALRLFIRSRANPYLDPGTKAAAKEKAARDGAAVAEAIPAFGSAAETAEAAAEADDEQGDEASGTFDPSAYGHEIRFDYDAVTGAEGEGAGEASPEAMEERRREAQQLAAIRAARATEDAEADAASAAASFSPTKAARTASAAKPFDPSAPLPRVVSSSTAASAKRPKINTSAIFASQRTVAQKRGGRNLGVQASARWSLDRPRIAGPRSATARAKVWNVAGGSAAPSGHRKDPKPFGTKRARTSTCKDSILARTISKADEAQARKQSNAKARKVADKSRRKEQNARR